MVKKSHGKSKRRSLKEKYKIQRRVKEHHRKARRAARRLGVTGTGKRKLAKDPGIPNLYPYKAKLLKEMEKQKQRMDAKRLAQQEQRRLQAKLKKKGADAAALQQLAADAAASQGNFETSHQNGSTDAAATEGGMGALASNDTKVSKASNKRAYYREVNRLVDTTDILLEVLDARDPLGCRARTVEQKFLGKPGNKRIVLVLNKIDLVPNDVVGEWLQHLRQEFPTIAFKSSTQNSQRIGHGAGSFTAGKTNLNTGLCIGGEALLQLLKNYSRSHNLKRAVTVGVIGYPNVGKSSLINSLKRSRAVGVSSVPGFTKALQEVQLDTKVKLIDCPGVIFDEDHDSKGLLLRNCINADAMEDPIPAATSIIQRCPVEQLMELYACPQYRSAEEFLWHLGRKQGKLLKGGVPDRARAARQLVRDWNTGRIPFYTTPPASAPRERAQIVSEYSAEMDLDQVFSMNSHDVKQNSRVSRAREDCVMIGDE